MKKLNGGLPTMSIEISGYVNAIDVLKLVATKHNPRTPLYKIVINNGGKMKVRVLFWAELAKKYSHVLNLHSFITLKGAKTKLNTYLNQIRIELLVSKSTEVIVSSLQYENDYRDGEIPIVAMADLVDVKEVYRYLKQEFRQAATPTGCYAFGVLVDARSRLPLRVIGFDPADFVKFPQGYLLKVRGRSITPADGPTQMRVDSFSDILMDETIPQLSAAELRLYGLESPKRRFEQM
ncbi:uncharacterized protein LOC123274743 isoform X2 [Cotesia glomerata]|uniref:uncharacterized protein LOC123274743 isoform X2 n=1 Tax=Cotesia glomerata TaxID=32391 RepID=UPI001D033857|nr:uncharacterized protein LOC123274743 isoform X2 [Cotesia glomerata]